MRTIRVLSVTLLLLCFGVAAHADSLTVGGLTFTVTTGTASSGTFSGDKFETLEVSGPGGCTLFANCTLLGEIDVKALTGIGGLAGTTQSAGWNTGILGLVGGGSGGFCNPNANPDFVCWSANGKTGGQLTSAFDYTFTAYFTSATGSISPFAVQATFYNGNLSNKVGQISTDITTTNVPEAGSLSMLCAGLVGMAGVLRRKLL